MDELEIDDMDEKDEKDENELTIEQFTANNVKKSQVRDKYNAKNDRSKYDDVTKRKKFKDDQFGDKSTITDPYTDKKLHKNNKAAKNKYGDSKYNEHTSQTDHTIPIAEVAKRNRDNVFLTDDDIKKIANIEQNYKVINGKLNQSKGSKSNTTTAKKNNVSKEQKKKMKKAETKANIAVEAETLKLTTKRANEIGLESAKAGALVGGIMSAAQNIGSLANGEEDAVDAVLNVAVDTVKAGASSYGTAIATKTAEGTIKKIGHKIADKTAGKSLEKIGEKAGENLVKFANSNALGKVITVTMEIGPAVAKFLNGEITSGELIMELGEKGTAITASFAMGVPGMAIGTAAGGVIGGLVGSVVPVIGSAAGAAVGAKVGAIVGEIVGNMVGYMVGSEVYKAVNEFYMKHDPGRFQREEQMYSDLADKIENYRINLEKQFNEIRMRNNEMILESFEGIKAGIINDDVDLITESLSRICHLYGEDIRFKTNDDFLDFWNDPDAVMEI